MKRIIGVIRYDTDKAEEVGREGDTGLFKGQKGRWFLCREFTSPSGKPDFEIVPLLEDNALDWLATHRRDDLIEKHFGDEIEDA